MDAITNRTPCGRIPNMPLRNPRHEAVAHALVQGMTCREAGLAAGYRDGPGLKGNKLRVLVALEYDQSGRLKLKLHDPVRHLKLLARNRGLLRDKVALTEPSAEGPTRVYVISDRPMTESEWEAAHVRPG